MVQNAISCFGWLLSCTYEMLSKYLGRSTLLTHHFSIICLFLFRFCFILQNLYCFQRPVPKSGFSNYILQYFPFAFQPVVGEAQFLQTKKSIKAFYSLNTCWKSPTSLPWQEECLHKSQVLGKTLLYITLDSPKKAWKGYLRYKTITSQNVSSEAQINNFFIS